MRNTERSRLRRMALVALAMASFAFSTTVAIPPVTAAVTITEYAINDPQPPPPVPIGITTGPDGKLWFAKHIEQKIGRINTDGTFASDFPASGQTGPGPFHITTGPNNTAWFTELGYPPQVQTSGIGKMDVNGNYTSYPLADGTNPLDIISGPLNGMWFTENGAGAIGFISATGRASGVLGCFICEYPIPTPNSGPGDITVGPDGNLWFTETNTDKVGRFNPGTETFTEFNLAAGTRPEGIVTGPDGNLWVTGHDNNTIVRMNTSGTILNVFPIPGPDSGATNIIVGPDGALWFPMEFDDPDGFVDGDTIARIATDAPNLGTVTKYTTPTPESRPVIVTNGPDGHIWFTEVAANQIGELIP